MVKKRKRKTKSNTAKSKAKKIEEVISLVVGGEDADPLLQSLNETELKLLQSVLNDIRETGTSSDLEQLWSLDYRRRPPTISQFVGDPYWLGEILKPSDENPGLFPTWHEILTRDFDIESTVNGLVITGSLGIGKTYVALVIFLYRLTLAALLRNPTNFFGLSKGSRIVYCIMSVSRATVGQTAFGDVINFMSNSPFFLEDLHFNPSHKYTGQEIRLGDGILLTAGSKGQHVIGRNTLGVFLDEGNFRLEKNPDEKAYVLFNEIRTRIKNRFQKTAGYLPAISIISSSAKDESSFTAKIIEDIHRSKDKSQLIYSNSVYNIKAADEWRRLKTPEKMIEMHALKLSPYRFKVAYGLKNIDPKVLKGKYDKKGKPVGDGPFEQPPEGCKVELVPLDYLEEFERNVSRSLQNVSGISTGASMRLFPSLVDVYKAVEMSQDLPAPLKKAVVSCSSEDDLELWSYIDHKEILQRVNGAVCPKRHPGALRFMHLDLATRTMAGLSMCHVVRAKEVSGAYSVLNGTTFNEWRLIVEFDLILPITSGKTKPINFEKIQKFIMWLRDKAGFQFGLITADQFQSHMQLEMLESRGFKIDNLSVDRDKKPYYALRSGFEDGRIYINNPPNLLMKELEELIDGPKKVDHPDSGTKDIADSVAGAYYNAVNFGVSNIDPDPALVQTKPGSGGPVWTDGLSAPISINVEPVHKRHTRVFTS